MFSDLCNITVFISVAGLIRRKQTLSVRNVWKRAAHHIVEVHINNIIREFELVFYGLQSTCFYITSKLLVRSFVGNPIVRRRMNGKKEFLFEFK